jgi:hypothetical protein
MLGFFIGLRPVPRIDLRFRNIFRHFYFFAFSGGGDDVFTVLSTV